MFRQKNKQKHKHKLGKQTNRWSKVQTLVVQITKSSLSSDGTEQHQRQRRLKYDLILNLRISREFESVQFVYTIRNIPNRICKTASKFDKEILKISRRTVHVLSNMQNWALFHTYWDFRIESIAWKTHTKLFHPITVANRLSHTWEKPFHPIRNQLSEWISQFANAFTFLASLQSSFTEVCRVSTSLLKSSRKFAINHRQSSNRFIALEKPIKRYI